MSLGILLSQIKTSNKVRKSKSKNKSELQKLAHIPETRI